MSNKTKTFRVRRVPAAITRQSLARFLQESVTDLGGEENIHVRSLAPSPDDWSSPQSQTATLEFTDIPQSLRDTARTTWEFTISGNDSPLIFDTHFLGFTPLNSVDKRHHAYDCIAVSGLASHPFGSWRQRRPPSQRQFMWLRDQLPHEFPTVRCMIYGYDTKLVGSDSFQSLDDLARSFISHLQTIGRAESSARPLIFVGHSLGGILVKRTLTYLADAAGDTYKAMLSKTKLFMAFGVPNRGMKVDHLLTVVGSRPNRHLIEALAEKPPDVPSWLFVLDEKFSGIAQHYAIRIVSAYETEKTPLTEMQSTGEAQRTGTSEILVQRESAVQCGSRNPQDIFHINRDHSNMIKFDRDDIDYFVVRNFVREALGTSDASDAGVLLEPVFDLTQLETKDDVASSSRNNAVDPRSKLSLVLKTVADWFKVLLSSLDFGESKFRFEAIERAHESTFGWIFEKPELGFKSWILTGTGVYWIRGKPGSGKSTFMKYLHDNKQLREAIRVSGIQKRQIDLWFFFNERGTYLQRSLEGLLRRMLAELISQEPTFATLVIDAYRSKPRRLRDRWSFEDLKEAFAAVLAQENYDLELTVFLDALDEYYGFPEVISQWILDITSASRDPRYRTKVRFCFSSREWDSFVKAFDCDPGFVLHEHTRQDVEQYIVSRLSRLTSPRPCTAENRSLSTKRLPPAEAVRLIADRAEGVFLWVRLAIDEIAMSRTIPPPEELEALISGLPADLEEFYMRTVSRIPQHSRFRAFTLLEIVSRSSDLVTPRDLFYASACAPGRTFQECRELLHNAQSQFQQASNEHSDISRGLLNLCGGLLECVGPGASDSASEGSKTVVQFIHQTVRDFVASPPFPQAILGDAYKLQLDNGYIFLLKYYCVLAGQAKWKNPSVTLLNLAHHDESSTGRPATTFIDSLPGSFFDTRGRAGSTADCYTSPFTFAVLGNLHLYVQKCLEDPQAHGGKVFDSHPLNKIAWYTSGIRLYESDLYGDLSKMSQILLQHGFDVHNEYSRSTPFEALFYPAALKPREESLYYAPQSVNVARVLIQDGHQDPNARLPFIARHLSLKRSSALHLSDSRMAQMLLENGADVNIRDAHGSSPLDVLVLRGIDRHFRLEFKTVETFQHAMLLLSHGGRLSHRRRKDLPTFLQRMRGFGFHFPDTLVEQAAIDGETEAIPVRSKISKFFSRHLD